MRRTISSEDYSPYGTYCQSYQRSFRSTNRNSTVIDNNKCYITCRVRFDHCILNSAVKIQQVQKSNDQEYPTNLHYRLRMHNLYFWVDNPQIQKPLMKNRTILALHTDRGHQYHTLQTYTALVKCSYQVRTEECLGGIGVESSTHQ